MSLKFNVLILLPITLAIFLVACSNRPIPELPKSCACRTGMVLRYHCFKGEESKSIYTPRVILCESCEEKMAGHTKKRKLNLVIELNSNDIESLKNGKPIYESLTATEDDDLSVALEVCYTGTEYFKEEDYEN